MTESSPDVVIVGGGIAGMTTAYYLAKAGVTSVVVERDAIGSHASGFAYGGLSPLSGFGIPGPHAEIARDGMRLHRQLSESLLVRRPRATVVPAPARRHDLEDGTRIRGGARQVPTLRPAERAEV